MDMYTFSQIDDLYLAITKISTHEYSNENTLNPTYLRTGTGFFYEAFHGKHYLITNRHIVIEEDKNYFPNVIRLYLHTDPNDLTKNTNIDIPLYEGIKNQWLELDDKKIDVVAIPADNVFGLDKTMLTCFSDDHLFPKEYNLSLGQQVMVVGYPLGFWYDHIHNLPVIRNGIVSSAYGIPYNGNYYFLVDARLHKGTSGAPVITTPPNKLYKNFQTVTKKNYFGPSPEESELNKKRNQRILLGINASTFPFPEDAKESDLNAVYFSDVIQQITNQQLSNK